MNDSSTGYPGPLSHQPGASSAPAGGPQGLAQAFQSSEPEILPPGTPIPGPHIPNQDPRHPGYAYQPPPPPPRQRRRSWASAPATYVLVAINCAVFLLMVLRGLSFLAPSAGDLLPWGADYGILVLSGQWWRLLTATFVHSGIVHLTLNMWCLWNLGLLGEPLLGIAGTFAVYVLTGIAGNLLSVALQPTVVGVGASGAIFGLAGVLILLLRSRLLPVPESELKRLRQSVIYFAVLNFVIGFGTNFAHSPIKTDNMAHLGGFLCGLLVGVPLLPRVGAPRKRFVLRQWLTFSGAALLLLLFAYGVVSYWRGVS